MTPGEQLDNFAITREVADDARSTREEFRRLDRQIERMQADRDNAKHYAAALYAITNTRPDLPTDERAKLASAIVDCQRARNLID
jgi:hypothetical protein